MKGQESSRERNGEKRGSTRIGRIEEPAGVVVNSSFKRPELINVFIVPVEWEVFASLSAYFFYAAAPAVPALSCASRAHLFRRPKGHRVAADIDSNRRRGAPEL